MVSHGSVGHDHTSLETDTRPNLRVGTNNDIGADDGCGVDFRRRVNHHITTIHPLVLRGISQQGRMLRSEVGKVKAGTGKEVFWLTDIHPEPLKIKGVQLLVGGDGGEDFFFDRSGTELNPVQNAGVEYVDTSVDPVTNEFNGLLDESINHSGVGLRDHDTIGRRLGDLGDHDGTFALVGNVEVSESLKGIDTGDIRVQNKERRVVLAQDFASKSKGTRSAERFGFDAEVDVDAKLLLSLFEYRDHDLWSVVDSEDDVLDTRLDKSLDLVQDHGLVAELDERLGPREGQGPKPGTETTDEDQSLHCMGEWGKAVRKEGGWKEEKRG